ncbi:MAG: hypothetical protein HKP40_03825 [Litoreibacter sp.]|nr:hypothetical protein [Litoreibacter sp.]
MAKVAESTILLGAPPRAAVPVASSIAAVAKSSGVSPLKQFREILSLHYGSPKLSAQEYYACQVYRAELTPEEKRQFVGSKSGAALNRRLSPEKLVQTPAFFDDKVLYSALLRQLGVATADTQAVVSRDRWFGNIETLRSDAEIEEFLLNRAVYPVFAKPEGPSMGRGSALLSDMDPKRGVVILGNGQTAEIHALAAEIFDNFSEGYLFQSAVEQNGELTEIAGPVLGTLRVVTVIENDWPRVLYALWKIPAPGAMSDNSWQSGSMTAALDVETGQIRQVRRGAGLNVEAVEWHPVSDARFPGFQIPFWIEIEDLTTRAHAMFPLFGLLGFDIAVTPDGPMVVKCSENPSHMLYQLANGEGVMNEKFMPAFAHVEKRNAALLAGRKRRR